MPFNVKKFVKFCESVLKDQRQIIDELAILSRISLSLVQRILTEYWQGLQQSTCLRSWRVIIKVGNMQGVEKSSTNWSTFFSNGSDPETKQSSREKLHCCHAQKACRVKSIIKTIIICFFDVRGVVHAEAFHLGLLKRLFNSVRQKRPNWWETKDWFFHNDNASARFGAHFGASFFNQKQEAYDSITLHSPTYLTLLCMSPFSSQEWRGIWKDIFLTTKKGLLQGWSLQPYTQTNLKNVYNNGLFTRLDVTFFLVPL